MKPFIHSSENRSAISLLSLDSSLKFFPLIEKKFDFAGQKHHSL